MQSDRDHAAWKLGLRAGFSRAGKAEAWVDDPVDRRGYDYGERRWKGASALPLEGRLEERPGGREGQIERKEERP